LNFKFIKNWLNTIVVFVIANRSYSRAHSYHDAHHFYNEATLVKASAQVIGVINCLQNGAWLLIRHFLLMYLFVNAHFTLSKSDRTKCEGKHNQYWLF